MILMEFFWSLIENSRIHLAIGILIKIKYNQKSIAPTWKDLRNLITSSSRWFSLELVTEDGAAL